MPIEFGLFALIMLALRRGRLPRYPIPVAISKVESGGFKKHADWYAVSTALGSCFISTFA